LLQEKSRFLKKKNNNKKTRCQ